MHPMPGCFYIKIIINESLKKTDYNAIKIGDFKPHFHQWTAQQDRKLNNNNNNNKH